MKKSRVLLPKENAAEVLFLADRTCVVCTTPGKPVQIHHIDDDPSNNSLNNLAVLCLDCHNQTMIKGGFGRQLDAHQILKYRESWYSRVNERKRQSDQYAIFKMDIEKQQIVDISNDLIKTAKLTNDDERLLTICKLLNSFPVMEQAQDLIGKTKYSDGTTLSMNQERGHMISFYESFLLELATFYPDKHFHPKGPKLYFRKLISDRFAYHRLVLETYGVGTGGSIVSVNCGGMVAYDIKRMILDLADALTLHAQIERKVNIDEWRKKLLPN